MLLRKSKKKCLLFFTSEFFGKFFFFPVLSLDLEFLPERRHEKLDFNPS